MTTTLERAARGDDDNTICLSSIAISLKRIADALEGGSSVLTQPLNQYGEGIGECIEGQLRRGGMGG